MRRTFAPVLALLVALLGRAGEARADGAFPDALSIFAPADRPHRVALATNFGLISSDDDGVTWTWVCEGSLTNSSQLYSAAPPPSRRIYALSADNLVFSDDDACDWSIAGGTVASGGVVDAFPSPVDASRVLAVVSPNGVGPRTVYTVVESHDGGATFDAVLFQGEKGDVVTGVEVARTAPNTIYVTLATGGTFVPALAITDDGGVTWRRVDLGATLGTSGIRLVAVDRTNPGRVFLRVSALEGESLAVFDAATGTLTMPLSFAGGLMTGFLQTEEGPLLAAGRVKGDGPILRSLDGGATWTPVAGGPHVRALAERAGTLYVAADDKADGYSLGVSSDLGLTFQPLMRFADVSSIAPCVRASCQGVCEIEVALGLWPASVCAAAPESSGGCGLAGAPAWLSGAGAAALALAALAAAKLRPRSPSSSPSRARRRRPPA